MLNTCVYLKAQDLEQIPDSLFIKTTGGINIGLTAYNSNGMSNRRDPFSYLLSANLTFNISDVITLPFSATISSGSKTYSQPRFTIVGISPKYKAVTLHAGYRTMQFSPYTLSGIMFLGGGIEIDQKEKYWQVKLMSGRLAKGIPYQDYISGEVEQPSFERWGYGGMVTVGNSDYAADLILFKAADINTDFLPDSADVAPKENLAVGINTRFKVFNKISISTEYSGSAYTADTRMDKVAYDKYTYINNLGGLFTPRLSSSFSNALVVGITYSGEGFSFGVNYKRVDPDYTTLGSTYVSNDFRNLTLNAAKSFLENKINMSGSFGTQKDNLEGDKEQTTKRIIGSLQGTYSVNERINLSANYSNFSNNTTPTSLLLTDSIKYVQVSKNYGGMFSYSVPGDLMTHNFMLNVTVQTSNMLNNTATEVVESNTQSKNALLSYTTSYQPYNVSFNASINFSQFVSASSNTNTIGPVTSISKPFFNRKLNSTLSYAWLNTKTGDNNSTTSVLRLNLSWKILPKHTLKFNAGTTFMNRMVMNEETEVLEPKKSNETKLALNYSMNF